MCLLTQIKRNLKDQVGFHRSSGLILSEIVQIKTSCVLVKSTKFEQIGPNQNALTKDIPFVKWHTNAQLKSVEAKDPVEFSNNYLLMYGMCNY